MLHPTGRLRTLKASDGICFFYPIEELPPFFQRHIGPPRFGIGFGFIVAGFGKDGGKSGFVCRFAVEKK